jgi:hypothetical protein
MQEQNLKNHTRLHPLFHFFLAPFTLVLALLCFFSLTRGFSWINVFLGSAFLLVHLTAFVARDYAKKNQDRIIRAEMRLRYFILTGKDFTALEERLTMAQIVALRFANDQDLLSLLQKHDLHLLSSRKIKEGLRGWKADHARV